MHTYACTCTYIHKCTHIRVAKNICLCIIVYIYIYIYLCMYMCTYVYMCMCMYLCMHIHIWIYTCTYSCSQGSERGSSLEAPWLLAQATPNRLRCHGLSNCHHLSVCKGDFRLLQRGLGLTKGRFRADPCKNFHIKLGSLQ